MVLTNLSYEKRPLVQYLLMLSVLYLVHIIEEKHGVLVTVCARKNVPCDSSSASNVALFVSKEDLNAPIFELDLI